MPRLDVGVLGIGEMGRRHAENIRRFVPEARLVAVASVTANAERARQVAHQLEIEHHYTSLQQMLECSEVDAVVIAAPDKCHAKSIRIAAHAGKSIDLRRRVFFLCIGGAEGAMVAARLMEDWSLCLRAADDLGILSGVSLPRPSPD